MKRPLNLAIIKLFTQVEEASASDVLEILEPEYGGYRVFHKRGVEDALKTAKENALLSESRYDRDEEGALRIYYTANEQQRRVINGYIKD